MRFFQRLSIIGTKNSQGNVSLKSQEDLRQLMDPKLQENLLIENFIKSAEKIIRHSVLIDKTVAPEHKTKLSNQLVASFIGYCTENYHNKDSDELMQKLDIRNYTTSQWVNDQLKSMSATLVQKPEEFTQYLIKELLFQKNEETSSPTAPNM